MSIIGIMMMYQLKNCNTKNEKEILTFMFALIFKKFFQTLKL